MVAGPGDHGTFVFHDGDNDCGSSISPKTPKQTEAGKGLRCGEAARAKREL